MAVLPTPTPALAPRALLGAATRLRPSLPHLVPLHREPLAVTELAELRRDPVWRLRGVPEGDGRPVALVPGFMAGDASLGTLTDWLRRAGYRTARVGIRINVGCSAELVDRLEERVERLAEKTGEKVTLVGQSRGGLLARGLAMRRPDLLESVVTLGSPHQDPFAIHPLVLLQIGVVGTLGTLGIPGLFRDSCWFGDCCDAFRRQAKASTPEGLPVVSVFSKRDGIVDWRSCLVPGAQHVEVPGTHMGMAMNRHVYRVLADTLASRGGDPVPLPTARAA
jgi:triacylglycerol lipase